MGAARSIIAGQPYAQKKAKGRDVLRNDIVYKGEFA